LADRPARWGGPSAWATRTVRPCAADRPKKQTEPPETTPNNGPSAGARGLSARHPRTVRPVHADRPKLRPMKTQSHDGLKQKASKNTKNTRRIGTARTVRLVLADRPRAADRAENARPRKSTPPNHHRISQTVEAIETRVWRLEKRHTRML
jgi:hypothetical protein